jgi:hypothetical protein
MSTDRPKRETMTIEEATVSNMWEIVKAQELAEDVNKGGLNSERSSDPLKKSRPSLKF